LIWTIISRKATTDAVLPIAMVAIPALFYLVLFLCSFTLDEARNSGWIGEETPPVQPKELLHLVDFNLVHWSMLKKCLGTWVGMVFVVAFASCLDIAAVSMDMGKPLDTNKEMVTVGASNFMSGLMFGFTGELWYIIRYKQSIIIIDDADPNSAGLQARISSLKQYSRIELAVTLDLLVSSLWLHTSSYVSRQSIFFPLRRCFSLDLP
jgi:hypothetical protein